MADSPHESSDRVQSALADESLQTIYFNGFALSLGTGDIALVLERNGQPVVVLNTSYTVAKTLAQKLTGLVSILESRTGNTIMSVDDVTGSLVEESGTDE